jgi:hypothetical protein
MTDGSGLTAGSMMLHADRLGKFSPKGRFFVFYVLFFEVI